MEPLVVAAGVAGTAALVTGFMMAATSGSDPKAVLDGFVVTSQVLSRSAIKLRFGRTTWADALRLWRDDPAWTLRFCDALARIPFRDFYWEATPLTQSGGPFECVVIDAGGHLATRAVDARAFDERFRVCKGVAVFRNLGDDATLVAPCPPLAGAQTLATFLRQAPADAKVALWKGVAQAVISTTRRPLYVITDGRGVPWLHVRVDETPKYVKSRGARPGRRDRES